MMDKGTDRSRGERLKTDNSLKTERERVDVLLDDANISIEVKFDEAIEKNRSAADQDLKRDRREEDRESDSPQAGDGVTKERERADIARATERSREDRLRSRERLQKSAMAEALLQVERTSTDTDLSGERGIIDSESRERGEYLARLQASSQSSKDELANRNLRMAVVSHDLRNPLNAISLSAASLTRAAEGEKLSPESVLKYARMITRNAAGMERMITQLLDVERIAQGKLELAYGRFELSELCRDSAEVFAPVAACKGLCIEVTGCANGVFVRCDYDRVLQVLSNLIGNAVKFTPEGGKIGISFEKSDSEVRISVHDNGAGIPAEASARIFDQFSQLRSNDRSGLGLGLYISKWIVEAHGGKISVASAPGQGTTLSFTLPVEQASPGSARKSG